MIPLLNAESLSKSFGSKTLFKEISLHLFPGDKVGLIGPNGSGKSTLLKILAGLEPADAGQVITQRHLRIGYVPQMSSYSESTPEDVLLKTLSDDEHLDEHERHTLARIALGKAGFSDHTMPIETLSGGWKKRLDIANALVRNPDILLLDEPTNHLDLESILWLEGFLQRTQLSYIVTSHDRNFLETTTSRMIELNPCYPRGAFAVEGNYSAFLEKREDFLLGQQQYQSSLASKVRREIEWLRQTPQARTTKSRSRTQEANKLIHELSAVKSRNTTASAQMAFTSTGKGARKLLTAKNISKTLQDKTLFSNVDLNLTPGTRVAIVGSNGTGKTTLMKILAGELAPDSGTIKRAEGLQIAYFDQHRDKLPEDISVKEALAPAGDTVNVQGKPMHVNSWGKRFLFTPERMELPVKQLSGGEKARILIARLMTKPADILFLDEPSNDLDITTLEILEENLRQFPGAVVFITHDRYMLNDLATVFLGLGHGGSEYLFADYYQWENYLNEQRRQNAVVSAPKKVAKNPAPQKRLTYNEKIELQEIAGKIILTETEIDETQKLLNDPALSSDNDKLQKICLKLKEAQQLLDKQYARWQELEEKK